MKLLKFNAARCNLCRECIEKCPFDALQMGESGIEVSDACRMCGVCVKVCTQEAITFEQKAGAADKGDWNGILVYAEQENGVLHPVTFELLGEAQRLASTVGYAVYAVLVGDKGTAENAAKLLPYGVDKVFYYEHEGFHGFKADCYTDAVADCIAGLKPSVVLIGGTACGRSLAPRLSTRFHTGLTADCTQLEMRPNTDLVQIRPAFGGDVMAQILITDSRPQFATVRYKVMEPAHTVEQPTGQVVPCAVSADLVRSRIHVCSLETIAQERAIEEEEVLVVAGRGIQDARGIELTQKLADALGGQLCFTRPMVELGHGDNAHQIGLSGRTVRPKLIITCGVSGAIQFTSCMNGASHIIAINSDPQAQIFSIAQDCVVEDAYEVLPRLLDTLENHRKAGEA